MNAHPFRTGFFAYPWDLANDGPENVINRMTNELGCNGIALNASYHHARLLMPRNPGPKTVHYDDAIAAFKPQPEFYGDLLPVADEKLANSNILTRTREACQSQKMDFGIWLVGLHNSSLGEAYPALCVENCFGDVYTYALCPGQIQNQQYLQGLVTDICTQFSPDRVIMEAIGVLGLRHWIHHELFMTEWDQALEMLTSICFCPVCVEAARKNGLDAHVLRQEIVRWGNILLEEERGSLPQAFTQSDVISLLMEIEGLWAYLQLGAKTVTNLVQQLHAVTRKLDSRLDVIAASFHRPISQAWLERAAIKSLAKVSDGLLVSAYFTDPAEVTADLKWASLLAPNARITAGLAACAPTPNAAMLTAQAQACVQAGCRAIYYFNYGLLNEKRLGWVAQANAIVHGG